MADRKWLLGTLRMDCALGNKSDKEPLKNKKIILYYQENGKYLTEIDNVCIELPLKISDEYPFNTGLDISTSVEINEAFVDYYRERFMKNFNLLDEVRIIEDIRNTKKDEWEKLKIADANWLPYALRDENYEQLEGEDMYNAIFYYMDYRKKESKKKYLWKLMPFYYPEIAGNKEQRIKSLMIPVAYSYHMDGHFTYLDKWKPIETPNQDYYCRDINFYNPNEYHKVLGLARSIKEGKDLTNSDVLIWYETADLEEIKKITEETGKIKSLELRYDEYCVTKLIIDILNQNKPTPELIKKSAEYYEHVDKSKVRKLIKEWLIKKYSNDLNKEQIDLIAFLVTGDNIKNIKLISFYDNDILSYAYNYDNIPMVFHNLKGYYNTNHHSFLGYNETNARELFKNYEKNKFNEYKKYLADMLQTIINQLRIPRIVIFHESSEKYQISFADLYLNKSLVEMYNAWVLGEKTSIELVYTGYDNTDNLVVRKGTIHQDGANKTFTFEEKEIKRTKFSKIERKLAKKEYQLGLSKK